MLIAIYVVVRVCLRRYSVCRLGGICCSMYMTSRHRPASRISFFTWKIYISSANKLVKLVLTTNIYIHGSVQSWVNSFIRIQTRSSPICLLDVAIIWFDDLCTYSINIFKSNLKICTDIAIKCCSQLMFRKSISENTRVKMVLDPYIKILNILQGTVENVWMGLFSNHQDFTELIRRFGAIVALVIFTWAYFDHAAYYFCKHL